MKVDFDENGFDESGFYRRRHHGGVIIVVVTVFGRDEVQ